MISPESSYTKDVSNELSFLLVTHMSCFDIRFGRYGLLKSGFSARQILDSLGIQVIGQVFGAQDGCDLLGSGYNFQRKLRQLSDTSSHTCFQ
jgi:hypothetical protein